MKKKIFLILTVLLSAFLFVGCQSEVNLYNYPGEEKSTLILEFLLDNDEVKTLERSAFTSGVKHNGYLKKMGYLRGLGADADTPWTVEQYIHAVMETRTNFQFNQKDSDKDNTSISFIFESENTDGDDDEDTEEEDDSTITTIEKGFFMYRIKVEQDNVFNSYKQQFYKDDKTDNSALGVIKNGFDEIVPLDTAAENYEARKAELAENGFALLYEENGTEIYSRELIPSFNAAFPIAASKEIYTPQTLKTNYLLQSNNKMQTSGETLRDNQGNRYYLFQTLFDEKNDRIEFTYYRANSVGWNVMAILIGVAVVGGLMLYCKFRKPKEPKKTVYESAKERFPYDPFENTDPFAEYGGKDGNDKNDPFAGY